MKKLICISSTIIIIAIFSLSTKSQPWTWSEDYLSYARAGLTAATLDDTIFYSGGKINPNGIFSNIWDICDISEIQWVTHETSSALRWNSATVSAGGKVISAGGSNYPFWDNFADVDIFDKETGEWSVDSLSLGRTITGGAVASGNKVFFAGGHIHTGPGPMLYTNVIDIYDTETNTWSIDTLSIPRCFIGGVAAGGKIYFAGGATGEQAVTNRIDIYDMDTGSWELDSLSEARAFIAAIAYGDKIYFAGGSKPYNVTSTLIEVYNITSGTWEDSMNLQNTRVVTALNVENSLVFTGVCDYFVLTGVINIGPVNGVVEIYYPETNQWHYLVTNLNPPRFLYAPVSYGNKAYYAGGWANSGITNKISILEYDSHCLPEGITFTTQEEIDNFQTNYPGCIEVEGDVTINGDDIVNLNGLNVLTSIEGHLFINSNPLLTSLSGLESLVSIGENLSIKWNDALLSLSGLDNVTSIGSFINIEDNNSIINLEGLSNLSSVGIGPYGFGLSILDNDILTSISGFESLTSIEGGLSIQNNYNLVSFSGMQNLESIGGHLLVISNSLLTSLPDMDNLVSLGGNLNISGNAFEGITGLDSLTTIGGDLEINNNWVLTSLSGLDGLTIIGGNLSINNNDELTSLIGLENIEWESIIDLSISGNDSLSDCDIWNICQYLINPGEIVVIEGNAPECNSIEEVQEHCLTEIGEISTADKLNIFPNPLGSNVIISYNLEYSSLVTLKILDLSGKEMSILINEIQKQGEQKFKYNSHGLKPGVYFCVLITMEGIQTTKMIKL